MSNLTLKEPLYRRNLKSLFTPRRYIYIHFVYCIPRDFYWCHRPCHYDQNIYYNNLFVYNELRHPFCVHQTTEYTKTNIKKVTKSIIKMHIMKPNDDNRIIPLFYYNQTAHNPRRSYPRQQQQNATITNVNIRSALSK